MIQRQELHSLQKKWSRFSSSYIEKESKSLWKQKIIKIGCNTQSKIIGAQLSNWWKNSNFHYLQYLHFLFSLYYECMEECISVFSCNILKITYSSTKVVVAVRVCIHNVQIIFWEKEIPTLPWIGLAILCRAVKDTLLQHYSMHTNLLSEWTLCNRWWPLRMISCCCTSHLSFSWQIFFSLNFTCVGISLTRHGCNELASQLCSILAHEQSSERHRKLAAGALLSGRQCLGLPSGSPRSNVDLNGRLHCFVIAWISKMLAILACCSDGFPTIKILHFIIFGRQHGFKGNRRLVKWMIHSILTVQRICCFIINWNS